MTNKELLYVEDALGHEKFMKTCSKEKSEQLQDETLANFMKELEQKHTEIFDRFMRLF